MNTDNGNGLAYMGDYFYYSRINNTTGVNIWRLNAMTGVSELVATFTGSNGTGNSRGFGDLGSCATVTNVPASFNFNCSAGGGGIEGSKLIANGVVQSAILRVPISNAVNGKTFITISGAGLSTSPSPFPVFVEQNATYFDVPVTYDGVTTTGTVTITAANISGSCSIPITAEPPGFCYKDAIIVGDILDTNHGITSLGRAGAKDKDNWPMVRKGAWTALESKTKGFVVNRLTTAQVNAIANPVEGMLVYDKDLDCLKINTDGTITGWKCLNTQTCP
jgi:hypothetical protein